MNKYIDFFIEYEQNYESLTRAADKKDLFDYRMLQDDLLLQSHHQDMMQSAPRYECA